MIRVIGYFSVIPGREAEFAENWKKGRPLMHRLGMVSSELLQSLEHPSRFINLAAYESKAAYEATHAAPEFKEMVQSGPVLTTAPPVGVLYEVVARS